ncbi:endopeptidase La, partial [Desulfovibrio sp. OttesenSCG-928-G15]|nr:endopeptidase La [Desulfovibrio sp. OttesenSCG-928-G15]
KGDVIFKPGVLEDLIQGYTREAGVRSLEREIGSVCRKLARKKAEGTNPPFTVTRPMLKELLGAPRYLDEDLDESLMPGLALGLAWTPVGGEVLNVEVTSMQGKGGTTLTGQLGDVMKESAQAAVSYARSHAPELGIDPEFNTKLDVHIHVPAGATPKDGPSAGVTLATALVSALTDKAVRKGLCMTGEITLRGRVLPVGGIKEKILAAVARKIDDVIIPRQNVKDLEDIPHNLLSQIAVHPVDTLEDVLKLAFSQAKKKSPGKNAAGGSREGSPRNTPRRKTPLREKQVSLSATE